MKNVFNSLQSPSTIPLLICVFGFYMTIPNLSLGADSKAKCECLCDRAKVPKDDACTDAYTDTYTKAQNTCTLAKERADNAYTKDSATAEAQKTKDDSSCEATRVYNAGKCQVTYDAAKASADVAYTTAWGACQCASYVGATSQAIANCQTDKTNEKNQKYDTATSAKTQCLADWAANGTTHQACLDLSLATRAATLVSLGVTKTSAYSTADSNRSTAENNATVVKTACLKKANDELAACKAKCDN